jgi:hypothetical protein
MTDFSNPTRRLRRGKQTLRVPPRRREEPAEASEHEAGLLKRIAAGVALNEFPAR